MIFKSKNFILDLRNQRDKIIQELCERTNSMWYCKACNYKSKDKWHVYVHVESQHISDGRFYCCPHCSYKLKARHHVQDHIKRRHKGKACSVKDLFYDISK